MSAFVQALRVDPAAPRPTRWVYVPYDQLHVDFVNAAAPAGLAPASVGVVVVENPYKAARRPYHQQKLAMVLANQRHFALELRAAGHPVCVVVAGESSDDGAAALLRVRVDPRTPTHDALAAAATRLGPLHCCEPAEYELREELAPLVADGRLRVAPHPAWLSTDADFDASARPGGPWRMDAFYRVVRRRTGVLMAGDAPLGGRYSYDAENRKPWRGEPPAPLPPVFVPDAVTREVGDLVTRRFGHHPGRLDLTTLPATRADAERLWAFGLSECLPHFGPYEDAMSTRSAGLFHTRLSAVLNLHRILPSRVLADVLATPLPLPSVEGFVRQVLGWREFVRHVHRRTRGFRDVAPQTVAAGDGGASRVGWAWPDTGAGQGWGGADPAVLGGGRPLPAAYWGTPSGLACLDSVVDDVWRDGWSHHITRLMVLANLATLLDVRPREVADWFWVAYVDAFDWVVEPNVLAMGTYGVGDLMTTKPYIAGAAYLAKMGDYCQGCAFDPRSTCPITPLYWDFLARHRAALGRNPRLQVVLAASDGRSNARRAVDHAVFESVASALAHGRRLSPSNVPVLAPSAVEEAS